MTDQWIEPWTAVADDRDREFRELCTAWNVPPWLLGADRTWRWRLWWFVTAPRRLWRIGKTAPQTSLMR